MIGAYVLIFHFLKKKFDQYLSLMIKLTWNKIPTYLFFVCEKTCYTHAWTHYLECIELVTPFYVSKH